MKYRYNTFQKFKPNNYYSHEEVSEAYLEVENLLSQDYHKTGGNYSGWYDSSKLAHRKESPVQHRVSEIGLDCTLAKCDFTLMDMIGRDEVWDKWFYFHLPKEFILEHQTRVLDNKLPELVSIFRKFCLEVIEGKLDHKQVQALVKEYDKKYPDEYPLPTPRPQRPGWRFDLEVSMLWSVLNDGIIFPIAYNNTLEILERGTHRALIFALTGNDIPVFVQNDIVHSDGKVIKLMTHPNFNNTVYNIEVDIPNNKINIFNNSNEKISSYNTCKTEKY
jgi:hypothetical protein